MAVEKIFNLNKTHKSYKHPRDQYTCLSWIVWYSIRNCSTDRIFNSTEKPAWNQ